MLAMSDQEQTPLKFRITRLVPPQADISVNREQQKEPTKSEPSRIKFGKIPTEDDESLVEVLGSEIIQGEEYQPPLYGEIVSSSYQAQR